MFFLSQKLNFASLNPSNMQVSSVEQMIPGHIQKLLEVFHEERMFRWSSMMATLKDNRASTVCDFTKGDDW